MTAIVIIPARYYSTRFPGKPLSLLRGKTLIQHVYENSKESHLITDVIVATDSDAIFEKVISFGGKAVMTRKEHPSGTDRIAEVAATMDYDIIVNVQGDEPLVRPQMIDDVILLLRDERASIGTLMKRTTNAEEVLDPNVVKVVIDGRFLADVELQQVETEAFNQADQGLQILHRDHTIAVADQRIAQQIEVVEESSGIFVGQVRGEARHVGQA